MGIDINKGQNNITEVTELTSTKISEMSASLRDFCWLLSKPSNDFKVNEAFDVVLAYVNKYDRLLYAEISNYCYHLHSEQMDNFQGNINSLVEYTYSKKFNKRIADLSKKNKHNDANKCEKTKMIILKLYDHVNLACSQMSSLNRSEEELHSAIMKEFNPLKKEITNDMSSQLITLVGIFTAIAFLVFGGFDTLLSIFANITIEPITKIIMLASLWGIVVCNGLFILLSCIERITYKQNISKLTITSSISKWANLILLTIFLASLWLNYIDNRNLGGVIIDIVTKMQNWIALLGIIGIIVFFFLGKRLIDKDNKK